MAARVRPEAPSDGAGARVEEALAAQRQSKHVAFRRAFSPEAERDRLELLQDLAALANSGGGVIVVGVDRRGTPTGNDVQALIASTPADLAAEFAPYLGETFDAFTIRRATKDGHPIAVIVVAERTTSPLVFERDGTCASGNGAGGDASRSVFVRGTVYFRHGGYSRPATTADVRRFTTHELRRQRREWNRNVRKVVAAPEGAHVVVIEPHATVEPDLLNVRVVEDVEAPAFARTDFDVTHPYRQTEVVRAFNERLGRDVVMPYDIQCVRRVHHVNDQPRFFHVPKFGSPQYSEAFLSWLLTEYARDERFFEDARQAMRELRIRRTGVAQADVSTVDPSGSVHHDD